MADGQPITVQLPPVPASISRDTLRDICQLLGLDPANVLELRLGLDEITATLYLSDCGGHKIAYGDGPAMIAVDIPIT